MNSRLLYKLFLTVFIFLLLFENAAPAVEVIPPSKKDSFNLVRQLEKEEAVGGISGRFYSHPSCNCYCTFQYSPVCGTDGGTYSNSCILSCTSKCYYGGVIQQLHTGACNDPTSRPGGGGGQIFEEDETPTAGNKPRPSKPGGGKYRPNRPVNQGAAGQGGIFQFLCYECHVYLQSQTGSGVGIEQIHGGKKEPDENI